jgi:hypothetical protein
MKAPVASPAPAVKRLLSSLAAIIAVTTIFGVKAYEIEQRTLAAQASEASKLAQARLETSS